MSLKEREQAAGHLNAPDAGGRRVLGPGGGQERQVPSGGSGVVYELDTP
jgi:hypothetical protein